MNNDIVTFFPITLSKIKQNETKNLTIARPSIACVSCVTGACVVSHSIATQRIDVTAVRVCRALVDI